MWVVSCDRISFIFVVYGQKKSDPNILYIYISQFLPNYLIAFIYLLLPGEDGDAVDPCILATLRKLQDGYFAGVRSVSVCDIGHNTANLFCYPGVLKTFECVSRLCLDVSPGCRCPTSPLSRPLHSTLTSASWTKRTMTTYLKMKLRRVMMKLQRNVTNMSHRVTDSG